MILKGKVLTNFWRWYFLKGNQKTYKINELVLSKGRAAVKARFKSLSDAERFGVLVDYFGHYGIIIEIDYIFHRNKWVGSITFSKSTMGDRVCGYEEYWSRAEVREEAIKEAKEIRLEQLNKE